MIKDLFIVALSFVVATIPVQMLLAIFYAVSSIRIVTMAPNALKGVIVVVGLGVSVYVGIYCFKKTYRYLKSEDMFKDI